MRCEECGFDGTDLSPADAVAALRRFPRRYRAPLTRLLPGEDASLLRRRPQASTWSALEYAAHVRDVFAADADRVRRTLAEDRPTFDDPGPDELAQAGRYNEQDPVAVADELEANAEVLASTLEAVPADAWDRVGLRHGEERSVLLTARRAVHEGNHHLLDVGRSLRAGRDAARAVRTRWVCPDCGLDYDTITPGDALVAVRSFPRRYRSLLTTLEQEEDRPSVLHRRPDPGTWSAVEYTAHVADVLDELAAGIRRVVVKDRPTVRAWDPDQRAAEQRYSEQDREQALASLDAACAGLAGVLDGVDPGDWNRTGTMEWGERDALTLARNAVHEGAHHLRDLERGLRAVRGRGFDEDD